jgi:uncharacterized protein (TIGR03118 family)
MTSTFHPGARGAVPATALALLVGIGIVGCGGGGGGGGGDMPAPTVSLTVQPAAITHGQDATLSWNSSAGSTCTAGGGWSGAQPASGSATVTPAAPGTVNYTLSCVGSGDYSGSQTQSVSVTVAAASAFTSTLLVSDRAGAGAQTVDANLVNGWGIAFGPTTPVWVANNRSSTSTLYNGNGREQPVAAPRVVGFDAGFAPTGIVFNGGTGFVVSADGKSAAAPFIFAGEGGTIAGWAPSVVADKAITMYTDTQSAVYTGLAIAASGGTSYLYAADFRNGKVDVFDTSYARQPVSAASFAFTDPTLPAGYAPFGIQAVANGPGGTQQIVVAYAMRTAPGGSDEATGAGLGLVNVFDANGGFVRRLVGPGGRLDAPWGIALAPADFGTLGGALLVGNFGDGRIHGYDAASGAYIGTVRGTDGADFVAPGLWGIAFGNDAANQPHNTLFYAAGPADENGGAYGRIDLGTTPPVLNAPPVVTLSVPAGDLSGLVMLSAIVQSPLTVSRVEFFVNGVSVGVDSSTPFAVNWDSTTMANGIVTMRATATDSDGNAASSGEATATLANGTPAPTVTLAQLQAEVFTPRCNVCHDGSSPPGGALPGAMNLGAGSSYASLVNVASLEQPTLMRVKPGDPDNSYLVRKLEGAAGITGSRMPLGGPFLDAVTIARVRAWIAAGAVER